MAAIDLILAPFAVDAARKCDSTALLVLGVVIALLAALGVLFVDYRFGERDQSRRRSGGWRSVALVALPAVAFGIALAAANDGRVQYVGILLLGGGLLGAIASTVLRRRRMDHRTSDKAGTTTTASPLKRG